MSQEQPRRPLQEPVKYDDVFDVSGQLASMPIAPRDAAAMLAAENITMGYRQRGGPAAFMQPAAGANERSGFIAHTTATNIASEEGVTVTEAIVNGNRVITEAVGDQIVDQYAEPNVPDKQVDQSEAAAICAAEVRATCTIEIKPGGIGSTAQSAATHNERTILNGDKTTIAVVLGNATTKMTDDKTGDL